MREDSRRRYRYQQGRLHKVTGFIFALSVEISRNPWFGPLKSGDPLQQGLSEFLPRIQILYDAFLVTPVLYLFRFCLLHFHRCFLAISLQIPRSELRSLSGRSAPLSPPQMLFYSRRMINNAQRWTTRAMMNSLIIVTDQVPYTWFQNQFVSHSIIRFFFLESWGDWIFLFRIFSRIRLHTR
jgi:hypothetical protein